MGTFTYTHSVTYDSGSFSSVQTAVGGAYDISDGEPDGSFEAGDTFSDVNLAGSYTYVGTFVIDGITWPVFNYTDLPNFDVVFMDQAPVSPPATLAANSGATYNIPVICFGPGTAIATPDGPVAVETLAHGDRVTRAGGGTATVRWIGRQTLHSWRLGARMCPVRISAGALGNGLPERDLVVTADHGMVLEGCVVIASALVNGSSIDWVPLAELPQRYTVYHVETDAHDVILAEGAPTETFIDAAGRAAFDNHSEYLAQHGADRIVPEMPLPRIASARLLPEGLRRRLGLGQDPLQRSA